MRIQKCKYLSTPAFLALVFTTCFSQGFGDTESPQDYIVAKIQLLALVRVKKTSAAPVSKR